MGEDVPSPAIQLLARLVLPGMDPGQVALAVPSRTPPAMPRPGAPRLAWPRLPLPIARPGPRGTSLRYNGPLSRRVPGPVRSGRARKASVRNSYINAGAGTAPRRNEMRSVLTRPGSSIGRPCVPGSTASLPSPKAAATAAPCSRVTSSRSPCNTSAGGRDTGQRRQVDLRFRVDHRHHLGVDNLEMLRPIR
jgi:hypothetical protein